MNYAGIIDRKIPNAKYILHGRSYDQIEWLDERQKPALGQLNAWAKEIARELGQDEEAAGKELELLESERKIALKKIEAEARTIEEKIRQDHETLRSIIISERSTLKEITESLKTKQCAEDFWREINEAQAVVNAEAEQYLKDTDFFVTRQLEDTARKNAGEDIEIREIPKDILEKRAEARARIDKGKLVYKEWEALRMKELPSREEIAAAIRAGGDELKRISAIIKDVSLKYPKPKLV